MFKLLIVLSFFFDLRAKESLSSFYCGTIELILDFDIWILFLLVAAIALKAKFFSLDYKNYSNAE